MTIDGKIRYEKLKYVINKEAANISALSSLKIDKYEYLTGEEILPCDESRITEQAKFTYSAPAKATEKHIEDQGIKEVEVLKALNQKKIKN